MDGTGQIADTIALTMGVAWASGINLYAAVLLLGILALGGSIHLPPDLQMLAHPWVIGAAGLMYSIEFFADKIPGIDSLWDALHTFIRIPAGAILAAGAVGQVDPPLILAAGIVGGSLSAGTHAVKTGTRVMVNTSPEPFSNWLLSIGEDLAVFGGVWAAIQHPWFFLVCLALFLLAALWILPRLWRGIGLLLQRLRGLFDRSSPRT